MKELYKRYLLFLIVCLGIRSLAVYLAKISNLQNLKLLGILYLLFGLGILTIFTFELRITGGEVNGGKIWWNKQRPLFGIIWLSFGILALLGKKDLAWKVLLLDIILGLGLFLNHHFI